MVFFRNISYVMENVVKTSIYFIQLTDRVFGFHEKFNYGRYSFKDLVCTFIAEWPNNAGGPPLLLILDQE